MKPLSELRNTLDFYPSQINYFLDYLKKMNIDFDVKLNTGVNLQRGNVWKLHQKQEIIWSMLMKRNIPRMAFVFLWDDTMQIIDGKQRLTAMFDFLDNKFPIIWNGKEYFFNGLPNEHQREISKYPIAAYIVNEYKPNEISDYQKVQWFKFINFAGTPQDAEHLIKLEQVAYGGGGKK